MLVGPFLALVVLHPFVFLRPMAHRSPLSVSMFTRTNKHPLLAIDSQIRRPLIAGPAAAVGRCRLEGRRAGVGRGRARRRCGVQPLVAFVAAPCRPPLALAVAMAAAAVVVGALSAPAALPTLLLPAVVEHGRGKLRDKALLVPYVCRGGRLYMR